MSKISREIWTAVKISCLVCVWGADPAGYAHSVTPSETENSDINLYYQVCQLLAAPSAENRYAVKSYRIWGGKWTPN